VTTPNKPALGMAEAVQAVLRNVSVLASERLPLVNAVGRALASDVISPIDLPLWDNSGMDGYAVQRRDVLGASASNPVVLPVIGTIMAGGDEHPEVIAGVAARIMTGAPIPPGANAVVRVEDTDRGVKSVRITDDRDALLAGGNIRAQGLDMRAGSLVFATGTTITPVHAGVLASVGAARVTVYRAPRVTLLSTGDELVEVEHFGEVLAGRRIVSSSSYALPPWLKEQGAIVTALPLLPDSLSEIRDAIVDALERGCDLLITTGGVSVGAHDYTRDALKELDADIAFWRARIRPGGPIGTGTVRGVPWIGLPGNPVSSMVTAELFVRPAIRKLGGHANVMRTAVPVRVAERMTTSPGLTHLLRVVVSRDATGNLEARLAGGQASNLLRAMALANALLIVPEDQSGANEGDVLDAMLLGDVS
jgi:molybdopterin molybdotransferase